MPFTRSNVVLEVSSQYRHPVYNLPLDSFVAEAITYHYNDHHGVFYCWYCRNENQITTSLIGGYVYVYVYDDDGNSIHKEHNADQATT